MLLPNQLTVLRIILTPFFLFFFLSDYVLFRHISIVIFIIAALTDWYDGWLARKFNYITDWGKFWDPLADKILTSAAFIGFVVLGELQLWMVLIIILRDFIITILRAYADYKGASFSTSNYAKWKTFLQMAFLYYLLLLYTGKSAPGIYTGNEKIFSVLLDHNFIYYFMLFITVITVHSGITYLYKNRLIVLRLFKFET